MFVFFGMKISWTLRPSTSGMGEESGRTASLRALPTSDYEVPSDRNNASHTFSLLQDQVGTCSDFSIYPGI